MEFARQVYNTSSEEQRPGSPNFLALVERAEKVTAYHLLIPDQNRLVAGGGPHSGLYEFLSLYLNFVGRQKIFAL